jgi:hypothetical protein
VELGNNCEIKPINNNLTSRSKSPSIQLSQKTNNTQKTNNNFTYNNLNINSTNSFSTDNTSYIIDQFYDKQTNQSKSNNKPSTPINFKHLNQRKQEDKEKDEINLTPTSNEYEQDDNRRIESGKLMDAVKAAQNASKNEGKNYDELSKWRQTNNINEVRRNSLSYLAASNINMAFIEADGELKAISNKKREDLTKKEPIITDSQSTAATITTTSSYSSESLTSNEKHSTKKMPTDHIPKFNFANMLNGVGQRMTPVVVPTKSAITDNHSSLINDDKRNNYIRPKTRLNNYESDNMNTFSEDVPIAINSLLPQNKINNNNNNQSTIGSITQNHDTSSLTLSSISNDLDFDNNMGHRTSTPNKMERKSINNRNSNKKELIEIKKQIKSIRKSI